MAYTLTNDQQELFLDRYALRDETGNQIETSIEQMWDRVAGAIGDSDDERQDFRSILDSFKFVPGGRILAGAGAESEKTFYNCYVIPIETRARRENRRSGSQYGQLEHDAGADSREAIFDTMETMVDIMSRGGGVGINWSVLRPSGSYLMRVSGTSSGPIGWMDVASKAVGEVEQGGSRRGAAMFMLDDWHPDVMKFIEAKREKGKITNANISVAISDEFMDRVHEGGVWTFKYPDTTDPRYNMDWDGDLGRWEASGGRVKDYGTIDAESLWQSITDSAHQSGEPGVVFLDRYNAASTGESVERLISVNPCGEQGLGAYSVCNLGAMNLDAYVTVSNRRRFDNGNFDFDFRAFRFDVQRAIRFLDNAIDKNYYFLPETAEQQKKLRRIGLGVMGLADSLVRLGIRYGSADSIKFVEKVFREMKDAAIWSSMNIAKQKGAADGWDDSMWDRPFLSEYAGRYGLPFESRWPLRNLFLLTVAPTGTTSLLAGVNGGIEPFFNTGFWREDRIGKRYIQPRPIEDINNNPQDYPDWHKYVVTAQQVPVEEHIAVQAAVQKWVDSSVSKTINVPADQSVEDTKRAYQLAWDSGLKGLAYYRDGSRSIQVLYHEDPNEKIASLEAKIAELEGKLKFKGRTVNYPIVQSPDKSEYTVPAGFFAGAITFQSSGHSDECSGQIVFEEGCEKCYTCSWTAC